MVKSGIYRYADMTALAWRALRENPSLAERLRDRFPLVFLDEAQDTQGDQLRLLEHVFKQDGAAFQRPRRQQSKRFMKTLVQNRPTGRQATVVSLLIRAAGSAAKSPISQAD